MSRNLGVAKARFGVLGGDERCMEDPCGLPHSSASCFRRHVQGSSHLFGLGSRSRPTWQQEAGSLQLLFLPHYYRERGRGEVVCPV